MDLSVSGWRELWVTHNAGGGNPWPSGIERDVEMSKFLHAALANYYEPGPIARLTADFATAALYLPAREKLWSCLDANEARLLAQETAKLLLKKLDEGESFPQPERALSDAVLTQAGQMKLGAQTLMTIISWNPALEERNVRPWIRQISLAGEAGRQLGKCQVPPGHKPV